jgi:hypothetical protein
VPPLLAVEMDRALKASSAAIAGRDKTRAGTAAVDVA